MSINLEFLSPKASFKSLLTVNDTLNGIDGVLKSICDGEGTPSPLFISANEIAITQGFILEGKKVVTTGALDGQVWTFNAILNRVEFKDIGTISIDGLPIGGQTF